MSDPRRLGAQEMEAALFFLDYSDDAERLRGHIAALEQDISTRDERVTSLEQQVKLGANAALEAARQWGNANGNIRVMLEALEEIRGVSCGAIQVADDDAAGMKWIYERTKTALRAQVTK